MKLNTRDTVALLDRLIEHGPKTGFTARLAALRQLVIEKESAELPLADVTAHVFPKVAPGSLSTTLGEFRKSLAAATAAAGVTFDFIRPDIRDAARVTCHFTGAPLPRHPEITRATQRAVASVQRQELIDPLVAGLSGADLERIIQLMLPRDGRERIRVKFFVSYARADHGQVTRLLEKLRTDLACSKKFAFEFWQDCRVFVGENWRESILGALGACDFGLALVSPAFFASEFITEHELPPLVTGQKPFIPGLVERVRFGRQDLRGVEDSQIFRLEEEGRARAFAECTGNVATRFVQALAEKIEERIEASMAALVRAQLFDALNDPAKLDRIFEACPRLRELIAEAAEKQDARPDAKEDAAPRAEPTPREGSSREDLLDLFYRQIPREQMADLIPTVSAGLELREVETLLARSADSDTSGQSDPYARFRPHQRRALDYLLEWLRDEDAPPLRRRPRRDRLGQDHHAENVCPRRRRRPEAATGHLGGFERPRVLRHGHPRGHSRRAPPPLRRGRAAPPRRPPPRRPPRGCAHHLRRAR
jgi:hypothetical protein